MRDLAVTAACSASVLFFWKESRTSYVEDSPSLPDARWGWLVEVGRSYRNRIRPATEAEAIASERSRLGGVDGGVFKLVDGALILLSPVLTGATLGDPRAVRYWNVGHYGDSFVSVEEGPRSDGDASYPYGDVHSTVLASQTWEPKPVGVVDAWGSGLGDVGGSSGYALPFGVVSERAQGEAAEAAVEWASDGAP